MEIHPNQLELIPPDINRLGKWIKTSYSFTFRSPRTPREFGVLSNRIMFLGMLELQKNRRLDGLRIKLDDLKEYDNRLTIKRLKRACEGLQEYKMTFIKGNEAFKLEVVVPHIEYPEGGDYIEIDFNPRLSPVLTKYISRYSHLSLDILMRVKSYTLQRFIEVISYYKDTGYLICSVKQLQEWLDVKLPYSLIRERIIERAQTELAGTPIAFDFHVIKEKQMRGSGRSRAVSVKFTIRGAGQVNLTSIRDRLKKLGLAQYQIENIVHQVDGKTINRVLYNLSLKRAEIKDITAYSWSVFSVMLD